MSTPADSVRLIRRLRVALVLAGMLVGLCVLLVLATLFYWNSL